MLCYCSRRIQYLHRFLNKLNNLNSSEKSKSHFFNQNKQETGQRICLCDIVHLKLLKEIVKTKNRNNRKHKLILIKIQNKCTSLWVTLTFWTKSSSSLLNLRQGLVWWQHIPWEVSESFSNAQVALFFKPAPAPIFYTYAILSWIATEIHFRRDKLDKMRGGGS